MEKKQRQAKHVLDRVRKEKGKTSNKKIIAMLQSQFTTSAPSNGVFYVTFSDTGAGLPQGEKDEKVKKKKEVAKSEDSEGEQNVFNDDGEEPSEVVYAEDNEYEDGDDFAGGMDDDE